MPTINNNNDNNLFISHLLYELQDAIFKMSWYMDIYMRYRDYNAQN